LVERHEEEVKKGKLVRAADGLKKLQGQKERQLTDQSMRMGETER